MKKYNGEDKNPTRIKDYWRRSMESTNRAMSRGAQKIDKIITWARQDNWRRAHNKPKKK